MPIANNLLFNIHMPSTHEFKLIARLFASMTDMFRTFALLHAKKQETLCLLLKLTLQINK